MTTFTLHLPDETETSRLAARLAPLLASGDVILLQGPLGAGKTAFARSLIRTYAGVAEAPSPTFTLVEIYEDGPAPVWHFDLYRLEKREDVWELGLEEALDAGVSLIEWPERVAGLLPEHALLLKLSIEGEGRRMDVTAPENWAARLTSAGICS